MIDTQQGDVTISADVGSTGLEFSISSVNGVIAMSGGLETAFALSLFGGNDDDDVSIGNVNSWWGNLLETRSEFMLRSRTLAILRGLPATSANLLLLDDAVKADLAWFKEIDIANTVDVSVTIPALNRVAIRVDIQAEGVESSFTFTANWKASI